MDKFQEANIFLSSLIDLAIIGIDYILLLILVITIIQVSIGKKKLSGISSMSELIDLFRQQDSSCNSLKQVEALVAKLREKYNSVNKVLTITGLGLLAIGYLLISIDVINFIAEKTNYLSLINKYSLDKDIFNILILYMAVLMIMRISGWRLDLLEKKIRVLSEKTD